MDRVRAHVGATYEYPAESQLVPLSEAEPREYIETASRSVGGKKLVELSQRAREFLAARGVLDEFDKNGLTMTTLAFDPKLLHTLAMAADMAGVPRRT